MPITNPAPHSIPDQCSISTTACAAHFTYTRPEFADLWHAVLGEAWTPASGVTDPVARQQLRNELDALVAHLYGLSRGEFAHILGAFPPVFPGDAQGKAKRAALS